MKEFIRIYKLPVAIAVGLAGWAAVALWTADNDSDRTGYNSKRSSQRYSRSSTNTRSGTPLNGIPSSSAENVRYSGQLPGSVDKPGQTDQAIISRGTSVPGNAPPDDDPQSSPPSSLSVVLTRLQGLNADNPRALRGNIHNTVASIESFRNPNSLTAEDRQSAINYLQSDRPDGITPGQHHWIVDELITTLRADGADNVALTRTLANLYQDTSRHLIVRDYALQHLGHLTNEGGDTKLINQTLQAATKQKEGTIAGTAVLALHINSGVSTHVPLAIARDETYDLRSRITALQVTGKQENHHAIPFASETASDPNQPIALRIAAIATLADLQATGQQQAVRQLSNSQDRRIKTAANAALQKLQTSAN